MSFHLVALVCCLGSLVSIHASADPNPPIANAPYQQPVVGAQPPIVGVQQPIVAGAAQPGVQQPGVQQPGVQQPGVQQPGVQPPKLQQPVVGGVQQQMYNHPPSPYGHPPQGMQQPQYYNPQYAHQNNPHGHPMYHPQGGGAGHHPGAPAKAPEHYGGGPPHHPYEAAPPHYGVGGPYGAGGHYGAGVPHAGAPPGSANHQAPPHHAAPAERQQADDPEGPNVVHIDAIQNKADPSGHVYEIPPGYEAVHAPPNMRPPGGPIQEMDLPEDEYRKLHAGDGLYQQPLGNPNANRNETESLAAEWDRIMSDFLPDMIVTFRLSASSHEHFQQDVGKEPVLIRGGFFESTDESASTIAFQVLAPSGKVAYQNSRGEGLFRFLTEEAGTYTFAVTNHGWTGHKYVTFVVGVGMEKSLTKEDVQTLDGNIRVLYRMLGDMETQSTYLWVRQKSHLEAVHRTTSQTYYALIISLVMTGIATMFQLTFIKKMVAHRRMF